MAIREESLKEAVAVAFAAEAAADYVSVTKSTLAGKSRMNKVVQDRFRGKTSHKEQALSARLLKGQRWKFAEFLSMMRRKLA